MSSMVQVGDYVTRKSYNHDIVFYVTGVDKQKELVFLKGLEWRLVADAPLDDLVIVEADEIEKRLKLISAEEDDMIQWIHEEREESQKKREWMLTGELQNEEGSFQFPGRVLHIDGDSRYMKLCIRLYHQLKVPVYAYHIEEAEMPNVVRKLLKQVCPDILILTGHDAYKKNGDRKSLDSYKNSRYFIEAVREARRWEKHKDTLVIFAGACQSYFEALLEAGANFASSPKRIHIHAEDPAYIAEKVSYSSVRETINIMEMVKRTVAGIDGIGGIETRGCFRMGIPTTPEIERGFTFL